MFARHIMKELSVGKVGINNQIRACLVHGIHFPVKHVTTAACGFLIFLRGRTVAYCALLIFVAVPVHAVTITVDTAPGQSGCTLADAIITANDDALRGGCKSSNIQGTFGFGTDTIVLAPNSIHTLLTAHYTSPSYGPTGLPAITSNIDIEGNNSLILRSAAGGTPSFRLFFVDNIGVLTLDRLRLRNGYAADGDPAVFSNTDDGAVVYNRGSVTIKQCEIEGNSAESSILYNGNLTTTMNINQTLINNNQGSAIANYDQLNITDSTISNNTSSSSGAGLDHSDGDASITRSLFMGNHSAADGGAILASASFVMRDSTISGNRSDGHGGGLTINLFSGQANLINVTIAENTTEFNGGGIHHWQGTLHMVNTLVAGNHITKGTGQGVEIYRDSGVNAGDQQSNLFGHSGLTNSQAFYNFTPSFIFDITATSDGSNPTPLRKIITSLGSNGGLTKTHALVKGSPAINRAVDSYNLISEGCGFWTYSGFYRKDQRGFIRPQDGKCDIGAYERKNSTFYVIPQANGKSVVVPM